MIFGGIYSSTRQAIKGPAVVEGKTLYIYPEQYEGQECDPLIFCTGPVPAQQVEPLIPWLMEQTGAKKFYLPSADYIWPHVLNEKVREVVTANGGEIVGEEYFPLDHTDYGETVERIIVQRRGGGVQHDRSARAHAVPRAAPRGRLHEAGRAHRLHVLRRELPEPRAGRAGRGALRLPRLLPGRRAIRSARSCSTGTTSCFPGSAKFTAGSACSGMYRGLKLWEAAVTEAGSLEQDGRDQGAGPREDRRGAGRAGGDGARPASRSHEHVHRPGDGTAPSRSSRAWGSSTRRSPCCR